MIRHQKQIDYFHDITHKILGMGNIFLRWLPSTEKELVDKEYYLQKCLATTRFVPKTYLKSTTYFNFLPSFLAEERIYFYDKYKKDNGFIINVAKSLKILHDHSRLKKDLIRKHIPKNMFLQNEVYNPQVIFKNIIQKPFDSISKRKPELAIESVKKSIKNIGKKVKALSRNQSYKPEYCTVIHGDLNKTNVVRKINGNNIIYLDWADARWDIASCDIAQFIYLHKLTFKEKSLFLKSYGENWISESILEIHRLLLIGWDLVYLMTIDLQTSSSKTDRLLSLKKLVWEHNKLAI